MPKHCGYVYIHAVTYICRKSFIFPILSEAEDLLRCQHVPLSPLPRNVNCREDKLFMSAGLFGMVLKLEANYVIMCWG